MNRIILFPLLLSITISLSAQPFGEAAPGYRITSMDYENASGETGTSYFRYDKLGKIIKTYWALKDGSRSSVNLYEYDSDGVLVSSFRQFAEGLTSYELFEFDKSGNKTAEHFYRSDSVTGSAEYNYYNGRLTSAKFRKHKGWLTGDAEYFYDDSGRRTYADLYRNSNKICQITYEYDNTGSLGKEHWDFNGEWSQTFYFIYERIDVNRNYYTNPLLSGQWNYRISSENYTYNDENGGPSIYYYNDNNELYKKEFIRSDGVSTTTTYRYDSTGKLLASVRKYSGTKTDTFKYRYDENNNLILRQCYSRDSLTGFEAYYYNSSGEPVKAYIKNLDNWLTGTINYKRDERGMTTNGFFKGENGFDADIRIAYNDKYLVKEIVWEFSFGKFQKYQFEWEEKKEL